MWLQERAASLSAPTMPMAAASSAASFSSALQPTEQEIVSTASPSGARQPTLYGFLQPVESPLRLEAQRPGNRHFHETNHSTYEYQLLCYWKASRPVARVHLATIAARRLCRGLRATWALQCMTDAGHWHLSSCRGCGFYPCNTHCAHCTTAWCTNCCAWSALCWKCYRPRFALQDCGEVAVGTGGPSGDGSFENPP